MNVNGVPASQVVAAGLELISQAKWDGVTVATAREVNAIYEAMAKLMNMLDADGATVVTEDDEDNDDTDATV